MYELIVIYDERVIINFFKKKDNLISFIKIHKLYDRYGGAYDKIYIVKLDYGTEIGDVANGGNNITKEFIMENFKYCDNNYN